MYRHVYRHVHRCDECLERIIKGINNTERGVTISPHNPPCGTCDSTELNSQVHSTCVCTDAQAHVNTHTPKYRSLGKFLCIHARMHARTHARMHAAKQDSIEGLQWPHHSGGPRWTNASIEASINDTHARARAHTQAGNEWGLCICANMCTQQMRTAVSKRLRMSPTIERGRPKAPTIGRDDPKWVAIDMAQVCL